MKTSTVSALIACCVFALSAQLYSQAPVTPKTPVQQLQELKAANARQIERQAATLLKLDELQKAAQQIKFLGKRS